MGPYRWRQSLLQYAEYAEMAGLRPYLPTAFVALLIFYFGYHALTGERGLLHGAVREETLASRSLELKTLRAEREDLETQVRLLREDNLSKDLLEERARTVLGFADPRDYVVRDAH
jgi:cell division protein FtsB